MAKAEKKSKFQNSSKTTYFIRDKVPNTSSQLLGSIFACPMHTFQLLNCCA